MNLKVGKIESELLLTFLKHTKIPKASFQRKCTMDIRIWKSNIEKECEQCDSEANLLDLKGRSTKSINTYYKARVSKTVW